MRRIKLAVKCASEYKTTAGETYSSPGRGNGGVDIPVKRITWTTVVQRHYKQCTHIHNIHWSVLISRFLNHSLTFYVIPAGWCAYAHQQWCVVRFSTTFLRVISDIAIKPGRGMECNCPQLPSCPPTTTNSFEFFWLHLRLMYPRMSQLGVQTKHFFCTLRSQHCFVPHFHSSGAVSDC